MTESNVVQVEGDIFKQKVQALGHGVNCHGVMGSGIAVAFKKKFPKMYQTYRTICLNDGLSGGDTFPWRISSKTNKWVYNIASQEDPGRNAKYDFLEAGLTKTFEHMSKNDIASIALPKIGCGIGGLNWAKTVELIETVSENYPNIKVTLVTYKP